MSPGEDDVRGEKVKFKAGGHCHKCQWKVLTHDRTFFWFMCPRA